MYFQGVGLPDSLLNLLIALNDCKLFRADRLSPQKGIIPAIATSYALFGPLLLQAET